MIVLDEGIGRESVKRSLAWYQGQVTSIKDLYPNMKVEDEAIPVLLRELRQPTFVTINTTDFWRRIPAHESYGVLCFPFPDRRAEEIGALTRELFRLPEFKTKKARMGKVAWVGTEEIYFYQAHDPQVYTLSWNG